MSKKKQFNLLRQKGLFLFLIIAIAIAFFVVIKNQTNKESNLISYNTRGGIYKIPIPEIPQVIQAKKDWETYDDSIYGFSIKYPKGWYLKPNSGGLGSTVQISTYNSSIPDSKQWRSEISSQDHIVIQIGRLISPTIPAIGNREELNIGTEVGYIEKIYLEDKDKMIYIPKGNEVIYIVVTKTYTESEYENLLKEILDSFTFK